MSDSCSNLQSIRQPHQWLAALHSRCTSTARERLGCRVQDEATFHSTSHMILDLSNQSSEHRSHTQHRTVGWQLGHRIKSFLRKEVLVYIRWLVYAGRWVFLSVGAARCGAAFSGGRVPHYILAPASALTHVPLHQAGYPRELMHSAAQLAAESLIEPPVATGAAWVQLMWCSIWLTLPAHPCSTATRVNHTEASELTPCNVSWKFSMSSSAVT